MILTYDNSLRALVLALTAATITTAVVALSDNDSPRRALVSTVVTAQLWTTTVGTTNAAQLYMRL